MKFSKYLLAISIFMAVSVAWAGEAESEKKEKPYIYTTQTMNVTAEVEAVNHETREVTLRGPEGNTVSFVAGDDVRNLAQVSVGDIVTVEYLQSSTIEVIDNPGLEAGVGELAAAARAEEGEMPGGVVMDTVVVTATVEDINIEANTFKLKWADESVEEFVARNPENLKKADVGDLVVMTYTQAVAISVQHPTEE